MNTTTNSELVELRELSLEKIEGTAGAGIISGLRHLLGGDDLQRARGPFNRAADHLK
jgi:hypothetical protein